MIEKIKKTIKENNLFSKDAHVVLGLSGGPDSMCLFDVLCKMSDDMNLTIHPVHINHMFRPGAADEDQAYVEKCCKERGLGCSSFTYDCNRIAADYGLTSEEAGRKARYQAFGVVASKIIGELYRADGDKEPNVVIAVAQNAQDQAETILFRILRGTSVDGLGGIAYNRREKVSNLVGQLPRDRWKRVETSALNEDTLWEKDTAVASFEVSIVRPLLDISREEIEEYCKVNNLNPRRDHTNEEALYTRNKIRLELLPYLKENYNQNILETINRLGSAAATDSQYLWQQAEKAFREAAVPSRDWENPSKETFDDNFEHRKGADSGVREISVNIGKIAGLHKAIRYRVYNQALREIGMIENVTTSYLNQIDRILLSANPSGYTELTDGYKVLRKYEELVFSAGANRKQEINCNLRTLTLEEYRKASADGTLSGVFGAFGGSEILSADLLQVRNREDGDYIWVKGPGKKSDSASDAGPPSLFRKKLQDFLVDEKVPRGDRDRIWVLARGREVLWVLPSDAFSAKNLREKGRFSAKHKVNLEADNIVFVLEII